MPHYRRYDATRSYAWNYDHPPEPLSPTLAPTIPAVDGDWTFCGLDVASPLGISAGPLLNGRWLLYYASLGFDVLTYKTVRSAQRDCYPLPNLQPVHCPTLTGADTGLQASVEMEGSWAVSFGMPSAEPAEWRADIEATRNRLDKQKRLSVSVVGSVQEGWTLDDLAGDYATCAHWAIESGADCVETNFSCPNVSTSDGQLYQQPDAAGLVAAKVRDQIGHAPYIVKIGHVTDPTLAVNLLNAIAPYVNAVALTNSVAATVRDRSGELLFNGERRGICGDATRIASISQTKLFASLIQEQALDMRIIGVGGIKTAQHVRDYLAAGAEATQLATAAMVDPLAAVSIRKAMRADR